jgi:hypothetical protein
MNDLALQYKRLKSDILHLNQHLVITLVGATPVFVVDLFLLPCDYESIGKKKV